MIDMIRGEWTKEIMTNVNTLDLAKLHAPLRAKGVVLI